MPSASLLPASLFLRFGDPIEYVQGALSTSPATLQAATKWLLRMVPHWRRLNRLFLEFSRWIFSTRLTGEKGNLGEWSRGSGRTRAKMWRSGAGMDEVRGIGGSLHRRKRPAVSALPGLWPPATFSFSNNTHTQAAFCYGCRTLKERGVKEGSSQGEAAF